MIPSNSEYQPTDEDVYLLRKWLSKMPHIVQDYDDAFLTSFVRGCKGSLQRAKIILEKFNSLGLRYSDFFGHLDIEDQTTQERLKETMFFPLPKRLDDGTDLFVVRMDFKGRTESKKLNLYEFWRYWLMTYFALAWENEAGRKCIIIVDWKTLSLGHAKEVTPITIKDAVESFKSVPIRVQGLYNINVPPALEWMLTTVKSLTKKKFGDRFHFISSMDTLYEIVPRELLPKEYGGNEDDIKILHSRWMKKVKSYRDRLVEENKKMRELDPSRPKERDHEDMVGTFKALNVD